MSTNETFTRSPSSSHETAEGRPIVTIIMLAWNEAAVIGRTVKSLARQTIWKSKFQANLLIYCNGCTDGTSDVVRDALLSSMSTIPVDSTRVVETDVADKSLAWNSAVHNFADKKTEYFVFLDADIVFASDDACLSILNLLEQDPCCSAVTGHPVKSIALKTNKNFLDRISLQVSEQSRAPRSINGQFYCIKSHEVRKIYLPAKNFAEDGFLNAMIHTDGFSKESDPRRVNQVESATHYYEPASGFGIFHHERRVTIGTIVNRWIFEYFWDQKSEVNIGKHIAKWNVDNPNWVDDIVSRNVGNKRWVVPTAMLFWRMPDRKILSNTMYMRRLPVAMAATAFTILVCWAANRRIKSGSAVGIW